MNSYQTAVSIGLISDLESLREFLDWPILKFKVCDTSDLDIFVDLRKIYGGRIWIDANGCWPLERALGETKKLDGIGIELIEQPISSGKIEGLRKIQKEISALIVADEDCVRPVDIKKLVGSVGAVNIKLIKCGGLRKCLKMMRLARAVGLKVMLGCKTESSIGVTAAAHLASAADFLDLDGHLDIICDPFRGAVVQKGIVSMPERVGIGVECKPMTFNCFN